MNHLAQAFVALTKRLSGTTVTSFFWSNVTLCHVVLIKCTLKNMTEMENKTAFLHFIYTTCFEQVHTQNKTEGLNKTAFIYFI